MTGAFFVQSHLPGSVLVSYSHRTGTVLVRDCVLRLAGALKHPQSPVMWALKQLQEPEHVGAHAPQEPEKPRRGRMKDVIDAARGVAPEPVAAPKISSISEDAFDVATEVLRLMGRDAVHPFAMGVLYNAWSEDARFSYSLA